MYRAIVLLTAVISAVALSGCSQPRHALPYDYKDDLSTVMYDYNNGKANSDDVVAVVKTVLRADRECGSDLSCRKVLRLVDRFKKGKITQAELEYQLQMERALNDRKKDAPAVSPAPANGK